MNNILTGMKRFFSFAFTSFILTAVFLSSCCAEEVKAPSVAGTFYPADKHELKKMVDGFLSRAGKGPREGQLTTIISPHAGYRFSGQVAAYGYRELSGSGVRRVILIGPSHHAAFKGASVYARGSFRTPLGDVKIDEESSEGLLDEAADVRFSPEAYEKEHSIEIHLPFLQTVLKDFTIVPILVGSPTKQTFEHLISRLADMLDEKTVIIASTDLSHYHEYTRAKEMDRKIISAIERLSVMDAGELLQKNEAELCGSFPVIIAMEAVKIYGATYGVLFYAANSGDVTGEKEKVVGYASVGLFRSPYTESEKRQLVALARNSIAEYVKHGNSPEENTENRKFKADGAVFVTIKEEGSLRGCVGHVRAIMPLYRSVITNAVAASSRDPRFPPITAGELKDLEIEVSVLSPLVRIRHVKDIRVGKHGLLIRRGQKSGLLLPQVPVEFGWDRETFLEQLCVKAGLPPESWKDSDLYSFTAEILR